MKPGYQTRRFTHVKDTVAACIHAWKKNKNLHYYVAINKAYSIIKLANMFRSRIKFLPKRPGERFSSTISNMNLNNKVIRIKAKINLKDYINNLL